MPSVVLITGAATGIGNLAARSLAIAGHTVYATVRDINGRNASHRESLIEFAREHGLDLRVVELDVQSQESADAAVRTVLDECGRLDTVVHNAGHLFLGYVEAFTVEEVQHLFDVNTFGIQRVNRAALPHMRERRSGYLIYVGSTTSVVVPPFLGPYVASKFAGDALAQVTAYEVGQFGIETTIVMPGPFTKGTEHYANASHTTDTKTAQAYAELDPLVARSEEAAEGLFRPGVDADPRAVAEEIARLLALPPGTRPFRSVVDFTDAGVEEINEAMWRVQSDFVTRMGYGDLLTTKITAAPS
ncbi:SDR family oxidoreductase [Kibdelosporangium aridum]|uniref:SDR family oxidoreductase n=1 Tax=Kibdelosporangium aridum TaxID=2030 RepID=UPI0005241F16